MLLLSDFYKSIFGCKVYKIALNAGSTCPNRDGTKGEGGCIFCSQEGSGDFIFNVSSIKEQFENGVKLVQNKAKGRSGENKVIYLPYFQAFTSTYGNFVRLKNLYLDALELSDGAGLCIATRPDCLSEKMLELFSEISRKHFLQIELGLQTSNEKTGALINRCYNNEDYKITVEKIKKAAPCAHIVTHIIFGLPEEPRKDMLDTVRFVCDINKRSVSFNFVSGAEKITLNEKYNNPGCYTGLKITNLYVLKNTPLEKMYKAGEYKCLEMQEYFSILKEALEFLPENFVLHRFTGDPPKKYALAPEWCLDKKKTLNSGNLFINSFLNRD